MEEISRRSTTNRLIDVDPHMHGFGPNAFPVKCGPAVGVGSSRAAIVMERPWTQLQDT